MATRSKRSVALSTTAITQPSDVSTPKIGDNSGKVRILDSKVIHQWVMQALHDNEESGKLKGTAVQRFAAAIIAQVAVWKETGHPDENVARVPNLAACLKDKSYRGEMITLLRNALLDFGKLPDDIDAKAIEMAKRTAQNNLLGRALKLAAIIDGNFMTLASFNVQTGCFFVPPDLIKPADFYWSGFMGVGNPDRPSTILLDGRAYSCEKRIGTGDTAKTLAQRVAASVEMVFRVATPQRAKPAPKQGEVVWDEKAAEPIAKVAPIGWLVRAMHARIAELMKDGEDMSGAMSAEEWSMASDIAQWNDASQTRKGFVKDAIDKERSGKSAKSA